jgi:hypothetical protein
MPRLFPIAPVVALLAGTAGCRTGAPPPDAGPAPADTAFHALQERGRQTMGVDQYTSTHRFDALPDGGRIELQRDADDPAGVETIREHLREAAAAFAAGDFTMPAFVHMREMPGAADMARLRDRITYEYAALPRGGQVRITTTDPEALRAVHAFLAAQRADHHSGGAGHGGGHAD